MPYSQPWREGNTWVMVGEEPPPPCLLSGTSLHTYPDWNSSDSKGLSRHNALPTRAATRWGCPSGHALGMDSWRPTGPWLNVTAWGLSSLSFLPQATPTLVTISDALWPDAFHFSFTRSQVRSSRRTAWTIPSSKESAAFVAAHPTVPASARARGRGYPHGLTPFS